MPQFLALHYNNIQLNKSKKMMFSKLIFNYTQSMLYKLVFYYILWIFFACLKQI